MVTRVPRGEPRALGGRRPHTLLTSSCYHPSSQAGKLRSGGVPAESSTGTQGPVGGDPRGCLGDSPSLPGRRGNAVSKCSEQRPAGLRACLRACLETGGQATPVWSEGASCVWSATSPTLIICPKAANCLPGDQSVYFSPVCTN